ncbi:hypothetical protein RKLH11_188 [Rhodobacteraceae bacterium KLH11]|nr:hypothetical protein RKLH11_188 [Rhodobacteraceae bacterium KLH11]
MLGEITHPTILRTPPLSRRHPILDQPDPCGYDDAVMKAEYKTAP